MSREEHRPPPHQPSDAGGLIVVRYVIGVLLFGGFVVFVTPSELAVVITTTKPGDPEGLLKFGLICGAVFGLPGYFVFPYQRRLQAVAWLSLACMIYSLLLFGILTLLKQNPEMISSPESRDFVTSLTIHYDRLAAITAIQLIVWGVLFRMK